VFVVVSFQSGSQRWKLLVSLSRRKPLAASCMAATVQRIAIEAERHRFTFRQHSGRVELPLTPPCQLAPAVNGPGHFPLTEMPALLRGIEKGKSRLFVEH
jgi:hypothetical protein